MEYRIFVTLNFENCLFTKMTCDNGKIKFQFQINCAGCRLHVYRNTWSPKIGQNLVVRQEVRNDCNPFTMPVEVNISGKLTNFDIVGHIPQKISPFVIILSITGGLLRREYKNQSTDHLLYLMVVWRVPLLSLSKKVTAPEKFLKKWNQE